MFRTRLPQKINMHKNGGEKNHKISYTVESSILVLCVDLFDVVYDVVIERLAEQFVATSEQSETQLE